MKTKLKSGDRLMFNNKRWNKFCRSTGALKDQSSILYSVRFVSFVDKQKKQFRGNDIHVYSQQPNIGFYRPYDFQIRFFDKFTLEMLTLTSVYDEIMNDNDICVIKNRINQLLNMEKEVLDFARNVCNYVDSD